MNKNKFMKTSYILPLLAVAALATGCSKENPFTGPDEGEGSFMKSSLSMDIDADGLVNTRALTRAGVDADVDDFTVIFNREGEAQPVAKYRYGDMPEVVALQAGTYTCTATYGENRQAEWESPYFLGVSQTFEVVPNEIVSYVDPIQCRLENIKVTVDFDQALRSRMSSDSYAEVRVGASSALRFGLAEADAQKGGFFMHQNEITLVAVFNGTVDGQETVETKSLKNIEKGNHYKIMFKLHPDGTGDGTGDVNADVTVDASVIVEDVTGNVTLGEDDLLDDSERPNEGGGETPPPAGDAPVVTAQAPADIEAVNETSLFVSGGNQCIINVKSTAEGGITVFTVDIDSETLTPEALEGVGLPAHLDIANTPADLAAILGSEEFGFPVNVKGQSEVAFNLTKFIPMLDGLGAGTHKFHFVVSDANGTTKKTLTLVSRSN